MDLEALTKAQELITRLADIAQAQRAVVQDIKTAVDEYAEYLQSEIKRLRDE